MHDVLGQSYPDSLKCITNLCYTSKEYAALYKELPFFMHGFYYHYVQQNVEIAETLYKEAVRRAEFTKGCYNMLVSIYL